MRLTTKIILGIILSVFTIPLAFIIVFSFSDRKNYYKSPFSHEVITISEDHKTAIDVGPYKVVVLDKDPGNQNLHSYWFRNDCSVSFNPVTTDAEKNKLFMPEELADFITVNTSNDTLTIKIKLNEFGQKYGIVETDNVAISGINLNLHTSTVDILNQLNGVVTEIRNIKTGDMKIKTESDISIYGCDANKVTILKAGSLNIENSKLKELIFDDNLQSWKVENCRIYPAFDR